MQKIRAILYKVKFEKLKEALLDFFDVNKLHTKVRIFGEEFTYKDSNIEFYCYSSLDKKWVGNDYQNYLVDIEMQFTVEEIGNFIEKITSRLEKYGVIYDLEYEKFNENSVSEGEEIVFRHPQYDEFMKKNY